MALYHAPTNRFTIDPRAMQIAAGCFRHAIRKIRESAKLPLAPYKRKGPLTDSDLAMKSIIDGAIVLDIDLGGSWGNELDVQEAG